MHFYKVNAKWEMDYCCISGNPIYVGKTRKKLDHFAVPFCNFKNNVGSDVSCLMKNDNNQFQKIDVFEYLKLKKNGNIFKCNY